MWAMFCGILMFKLIIPEFESFGPSTILRSIFTNLISCLQKSPVVGML